MEVNGSYKKLESNFIHWADTVDDIRAAVIVGSRARLDHPADEWSDLDIVIFTSRSDFYIGNDAWLKEIGNPWTSFVSTTSGGDVERLVLFSGGLQADFVIKSDTELIKIQEGSIPEGFNRGFRIIVDKDSCLAQITDGKTEVLSINPKPVHNEEFLQVVNMFWFASMYVAKQILRNELWIAKTRDTDMKQLLLKMMEWHAVAVHHKQDIWHAGKFMREWVEADVMDQLDRVFGRFNQEDSWTALISTMNLFRDLSLETAEKLNIDYPDELDLRVTTWITGVQEQQ
ncbi:MAG: aminoglycoside 6-adenylyltransferase [Bacillota bacterium]